MSEEAVVENEQDTAVEETEDPEYAYLVDKEPTHLHKHYVEWIKEKTGLEVSAKSAQLAVSLYQKYQKSPENAERREAEREERDARAAEAREAREKAAAEKKAKAEAERLEKAEKAKTAKAEAADGGTDDAPSKSAKKVVKKPVGKAGAAKVEAPF